MIRDAIEPTIDSMADAGFLERVYEARDRYAHSLGAVSPDVIAPAINPAFMGGPRWPDLRQAWKVIRRGNETVIMSDGLSDPFSDAMEPDAGFGIEVLVQSMEPVVGPVQDGWLFDLAYQVSQNCAFSGRVRETIDRLGVISLEIPAGDATRPFAAGHGNAGVLLGLEADFPTQFTGPAGVIKVVTAKLLWPSELQYVVTERAAGRAELAKRFAADGTRHRSSVARPPVI